VASDEAKRQIKCGQWVRCHRNSPILRALTQTSPHGVERKVAHSIQPMRLIHGGRMKPPLKHVAGHARTCIDEAAIAPVCLADCARQALGRCGRQHEMNMVRHQAPGPARYTIRSTACRQQIAVKRIVALLVKDGFTPVAALRHMMRQSGNREAGDAWHQTKLSDRSNAVNG
jgi:hypothetical protein